MEVGKEFKDINMYNQNMAKHLEDKMFWYDRFKDDGFVLVDFGCADGSIINQCCEFDKQYGCSNGHEYVGYDISETMIDLAKTNFRGENSDNVMFTSSWDDVKKRLDTANRKILLLSSVIHEVYSYANGQEDIAEFWSRVLESGFDYIIVRDMMVSRDTMRQSTWPCCRNVLLNNVEGTKYELMLHQFEEKWGKCDVEKNRIHFLLKSNWVVNWEREVNENYFPIYVESFLNIMSPYNLDYLERFQVPYLKKQIFKNLHEVLCDNTHIKCIFSKKHSNEKHDEKLHICD